MDTEKDDTAMIVWLQTLIPPSTHQMYYVAEGNRPLHMVSDEQNISFEFGAIHVL